VVRPLTPAMFAVLLALTEGERHGYGLISDVDRLTEGAMKLGPGTLYRTLQRMRVERLVEEIDSDEATIRGDRRAERRRVYRITDEGRRIARDEVCRLATLLSTDTAQALLREPEEER
jgi:DNA-binding PadR family transcriptional regulator